MKFVITVLLIFCVTLSWATHNRSGEITYRQIGPNSIEIEIVTYTKISGQSIQADRDELPVNWGDGSATEIVPRVNFIDGQYPDIRQNIYVAQHTYPGPNPAGQPYIVSMQDPNRNDNILNINGGSSVNVPFYLQTEVFILNASFFGFNSSPILLEPPVDFGVVGQVFQHTPNGYDPDGDSIAYELIVPLSDIGTTVPGYQLVTDISPGPLNQYTFDPLTGLFTWDSPQQAGEYNIAILVKSYRNGLYLGGIVRDIQIKIINGQNTPPIVEVIDELCVIAGENITFDVTTWDEDSPLQIVNLTATGGPFNVASSPATFTPVSGLTTVSSPLVSTFSWQTNCSHVQKNPWQLVFKSKDTYTIGNVDASLATFKVVRIRVIGPPPQNLTATVQPTSATLSWDAPYACSTWEGFLGFSVWRKIGCDNFTPDSCEVGLSNQGYTKISSTPITTAIGSFYTYTDNTIQNDISYSYRVVPEFATPIYNNGIVVNYNGLVDGIASNEVCIKTKEDLPIIINVDVQTTDVANGSIFVRWTKPNTNELDTLIYLPPYRYELYHSSDQTGNLLSNIPVYSSPSYTSFYAANDTFFTHTLINTKDLAHSYLVRFYSNQDTIGDTKLASSIYLTVASTDAKNTLTWTENVPWQNVQYVVFEETPINSGIFTMLDTVLTPIYEHLNLTNDQTYCYRVQSLGSYFTSFVPDTLINHSQIACGTPLDTIPPCPPIVLSSISSCSENSDDANNPERKECTGTITSPEFLFNQITWSLDKDTCAADLAFFRLYFSPNCDGNYTMIFQSLDRNDTTFLHQPSNENLAGCYYVTSIDSLESNGGDNESEPSEIIVTDNCPFIELPNTFTPNGDGFNDLFTPCLIYRYVSSIDFKVTNRWGELVYQTDRPNIDWDGKHYRTGKDLQEGVYFYTCQVKYNCLSCDPPEPLSGFVQIIR